MSDEEKQISEDQQAIQHVFWKIKDSLINQEGFDPNDVILAFYRSALVAYMHHKQEANEDVGVEEIAKYIKNCRVTKHDTN